MTYYRRQPLGGEHKESPALKRETPSSWIRPRFPLPAEGESSKRSSYGRVGEGVPPVAPEPNVPGTADAMEEAAKLLGAAASILDEETATGALAARNVSSPATEPSRGSQSQYSNEALWRDLHDLVDAIAESIPRVLQHASAPDGAMLRGDSEQIPEIRCQSAVKPGHEGSASFKVRNEESASRKFALQCTDLLGPNGARIGSQHVSFSDSRSGIEPGKEIRVSVTIAVPKTAISGSYTGLIVAQGVDYLRALLTVEVD